VLVTSGGCASGKGYSIGNVKEAAEIAKTVGAVWDAAGELNATENPWVKEELKKRGLKGVFMFADSDPSTRWENPKLGVVERAKKVGRMVDARLFADSYAIGAKNFQAFADQNKNDPDMQMMVLSSRTQPPSKADSIAPETLALDSEKIYAHVSKVIDDRDDLPARVRRGASTGRRIWGAPSTKESRMTTKPPIAETHAQDDKLLRQALELRKLADALLKNLTKHLDDPEPIESEKAERDAKVRPLPMGKRVVPPELNLDGTLKR
jgi:hypothetical protein